MAFLFSPKVRAYSDESLESYLLRVVAENFFDSYEQLSLAIREELHELDFEAHGAFPIELERLNVYHAKHNSHFRMRAFSLLESLLNLPPHELQKLALLRSNKRFVGGMSAVHRNGVDIPLSFIRYADDGIETVPVCPQCLKEEAYIRQVWHLKPVNVCAKHECELLHHCPECQQPINHIENESINHCACGFDFTTASSKKADNQEVALARSLFEGDALSNNPLLFMGTSATQRFAALLWYKKRHAKNIECKLDESVNYFEAWPKNFYQELDEFVAGAELKLIDLFNRTSLSFIFGELILQSQCLLPEDKTPHFIYMGLMEYLSKLVESHPKSKKPNVADMLVSVAEAAVLLSTSHEQVYRLYQDGILTSAIRQKIRTRIDPHIGVFYLRQVIEYKTSFGNDKQGMYLSTW
ncbi:hypothetical protein A9267_17185 [Shewanella sp. UCD-FRSSP16_17]|uniref:TniQ family protein n=1 Tax=Shewanella sp. UCD-FRSSP16_17 TaxID=1853256 RepID=UPI0007EEDE5E|nr:TniQ family protein [Shewanella sp. UCD-FRSSP16_17]OBT04683.1 hypothetical protein A9267_17185 [Shewanella sp. UCD-FRSSP16_17]